MELWKIILLDRVSVKKIGFKFLAILYLRGSSKAKYEIFATKVCSEKKFTHICMYYANSGRASVKSLRSAKSRHPEDSKLVRQVLIIQKILPENVIEQKKFFCENTIFVKKY